MCDMFLPARAAVERSPHTQCWRVSSSMRGSIENVVIATCAILSIVAWMSVFRERSERVCCWSSCRLVRTEQARKTKRSMSNACISAPRVARVADLESRDEQDVRRGARDGATSTQPQTKQSDDERIVDACSMNWQSSGCWHNAMQSTLC